MSRFVLTAQLQLQAPNNVAQVVNQIQSQLNGINVNLNVQGSAQAQRQLQQVTAQTQAATTAAGRMGQAFAISIRRFAAFSIATRAVSLFTSTLSDAVKTAIDFEREMIRVSQVTGETVGNLKFLTQAITGLSTGLGVSSKDLLQTGQLLLQAGINAKDTEIALKTLAKAALAPNFDSLSETTEGAIAILAQFQQGVGALEAQLGAINAVAGAFAVEAGDLIDVIRRAGGVFKASGGDLNELIALFTSVRATTRESAESIGTGLRTIFTRIQRPKTIEFLKQFGVELVDMEGKFVGPYEAVKRLSTALAGLGEGDITFIRIAEELGGFRQIGKVLPLLQQFSTAQAALNVAQKSGNSLTKDAETAQQALAIRIVKVKEEFLALIRSVTETTTFQVMANTALSLAGALIKIGEAIKPLLPLLAAVAAVKFARGISTFAGGLMRGMQSGRTYSTGGKVHHFARGGMVPGTGNRDTVPAMLSPGEFVIKKSSVNKLGAGNLAAMNQNRYADGGRAIVGATQKLKSTKKRDGKYGVNKDVAGAGNIQFDVNDGQVGAFVLTPPKGSEGGYSATQPFPFTLPAGNKYAKIAASQAGLSPDEIKGGVNAVINPATYPVFYPGMEEGKRNLENNAKYAAAAHKGFLDGISTGVNSTINSVVSQGLLDLPPGLNTNEKLMTGIVGKIQSDNQVRSTIEGYLFEAMISAFTGATAAGGRANFDFPRSAISQNKDKLGTLFGSQAQVNKLIKAEAKRSYGEVGGNIQRKLANDIINGYKGGVSLRTTGQRKHFGGIIQKFANGGMAKAPLIDDIVNATGTVIPRPSSAIAALISAGGGAIDIDRTLKRTIGDKAYGMAKTSGQQSAALDKFFRDPQARLRDVTSAPLTTFGKELQTAIKSGQLSPGRLSIISKSSRVPGVAEYLNRLFGIPLANMMFTSGGSKQPAMDALRSKGPRVNRVARFAAGGGVGTDTVPALLTPGEFVVNRSSAQNIGYGTLNRMNKVGKYAKGGIVQYFGKGTSGRGATAVATAQTTDKMIATLSTKEAARVKMSMNKNADVFDSLTVELQNMLYMEKDVVAAYKALTRSLEAGKKSEDALVDAKNAAEKSLNADAATKAKLGSADRPQQQFENVVNTPSKRPGSDTIFEQAKKRASEGKQLSADDAFGRQAYAKLTTEQLKQVNAIQKATAATNSAARADTEEAAASKRAASADSLEAQSSKKMDFGNVAMGLSMVSGTIQAMLPPLDENSGLLLKMSHGLLGLLTTVSGVAFALTAFGVTLTGATIAQAASAAANFLLGNAGAAASASCTALAVSAGWAAKNLGMSSGMSMGIAKFIQGAAGAAGKVATVAGPFIAAAAATYLVIKGFNALVSSLYDVSAELKKAIEGGNVSQASSLAGQQYDLEAANTTRAAVGTIGAIAGGAIGAFFGGTFGMIVGAAIGSAAGSIVGTIMANLSPELAEGINRLFGGNTRDSAVKLAAAQAGAVKTQKSLDQAQKTATTTMQDFENGTISAAEALKRITTASAEAVNQQNRAFDFAQSNTENRAGGASGFSYFREVGANLTLGWMDSSQERNTRLGEESAKQIRGTLEGTAKAFDMASGARTGTIRMGIATKQDRKDIRNRALGVGTENDLLARQRQLAQKATQLGEAGDFAGAEAAHEAFMQVTEQIKQTDRELANLEKEMKRSAAALNAMNLGLRGPEATATALSASMDRFSAGLQVGGNTFVANAEFLSQAMTSAAQSMDPDDIKSAMNDVSNNLRSMGADPTKFEANTQGFIQAQQNYNSAFKKVVGNLNDAYKSGRSLKNAPDDLKKAFAEELTVGLGGEAKKNLKAIIEGIELSPTEVEQILGGNLQVFGDKLSEAGQKQFETIIKIAQERQKAEQVVIGLIQQRAEAERNLAQAQKEAVDLYMEGRDIQAKYGGRTVSAEEKRAAIIARGNTSADMSGVGRMRTGSVAELRQRQGQIAAGFANIEQRRSVDGGMAGTAGADLNETQKNLDQAQKDQVQTIRDLIKLEEEELKILQEKNRMEKDSLEALISGDVDKFFEGQAAMGAQAAIATGDMRTANMYGSKAIADAFKDIQRQQEAGVQTMFGRQLSGPGGLAEQAAQASLGARGITDPRMAQVLAGTTPEEEARKARLRELGGVLGEAGMAQASMAEMQVQTANINVANAELKLSEIEQRGREAAAAMNRGGVVYANRGIFVPRGTDTVPAMLTPGEFVVRREAVNRGNNLQLLRAINSGGNANAFARGGKVGYYNNGGMVQYKFLGDLIKNASNALGIDPQLITNLGNVFNSFVNGFNESIKNLQNTKLQIKMDSVNVNVNLNASSMLGQVSTEAKKKIMEEVIDKIRQEYSIGPNGKLKPNNSKLP